MWAKSKDITAGLLFTLTMRNNTKAVEDAKKCIELDDWETDLSLYVGIILYLAEQQASSFYFNNAFPPTTPVPETEGKGSKGKRRVPTDHACADYSDIIRKGLAKTSLTKWPLPVLKVLSSAPELSTGDLLAQLDENDKMQMTDAHVVVGFSWWFMGRKDKADEHFQKALDKGMWNTLMQAHMMHTADKLVPWLKKQGIERGGGSGSTQAKFTAWMNGMAYQKSLIKGFVLVCTPLLSKARLFRKQCQYRAVFEPFISDVFYFYSYHGLSRSAFEDHDKDLLSKGFEQSHLQAFRNQYGEKRYQATWTRRHH